MMRKNTWRFFSKSLTCLQFAKYVFADLILFIYSKENCIWHLLASISALFEFVSSSVPPAFSNKYTHRLTHYWLKGDGLEKLKGHIAFGLSVCTCVRPLQKLLRYSFEISYMDSSSKNN